MTADPSARDESLQDDDAEREAPESKVPESEICESEVPSLGPDDADFLGLLKALAKPPEVAEPQESSPGMRIGEVVGGKYTLRRLIGCGGMGDVYEAIDAGGNVVAVKLMSSALDRDTVSRKRFVREIRAAMRIVDPHVVRVLDADSDPVKGQGYLVMELLNGTDLGVLLAEHGALDPAATCAVFYQAAQGLIAAHRIGFVHRDIKPANLFLHESSTGEVTVKICDFGVAKELTQTIGGSSATKLTHSGSLVGTVVYMSPEQAKNAKYADARTDVWSLSLSLYEALSGEKPWEDARSIAELTIAICTQDLPPLLQRAPWIDPRLAAVVDRGLRRDLGARWSSIDELAKALLPFCSTAPLTRDMLGPLSPERREHRANIEKSPPLLSRLVAWLRSWGLFLDATYSGDLRSSRCVLDCCARLRARRFRCRVLPMNWSGFAGASLYWGAVCKSWWLPRLTNERPQERRARCCAGVDQ